MNENFMIGLKLIEKHRSMVNRPNQFELLGRCWDLLPEVFSPTYTASTQLFSNWLPYPIDGHFLEVGSGAGVISVTAALHGCLAVTALDINEAAVRNTYMNACRHHVDHRIRVVHSDLFNSLNTDERFDVIFWNSSVIEPPDAYVYDSSMAYAVFDTNYVMHTRFLREGIRRLTPTGKLLLGFNSLGNLNHLCDLAKQLGLEVHITTRSTAMSGEAVVEFQLLELKPLPGVNL